MGKVAFLLLIISFISGPLNAINTQTITWGVRIALPQVLTTSLIAGVGYTLAHLYCNHVAKRKQTFCLHNQQEKSPIIKHLIVETNGIVTVNGTTDNTVSVIHTYSASLGDDIHRIDTLENIIPDNGGTLWIKGDLLSPKPLPETMPLWHRLLGKVSRMLTTRSGFRLHHYITVPVNTAISVRTKNSPDYCHDRTTGVEVTNILGPINIENDSGNVNVQYTEKIEQKGGTPMIGNCITIKTPDRANVTGFTGDVIVNSNQYHLMPRPNRSGHIVFVSSQTTPNNPGANTRYMPYTVTFNGKQLFWRTKSLESRIKRPTIDLPIAHDVEPDIQQHGQQYSISEFTDERPQQS